MTVRELIEELKAVAVDLDMPVNVNDSEYGEGGVMSVVVAEPRRRRVEERERGDPKDWPERVVIS